MTVSNFGPSSCLSPSQALAPVQAKPRYSNHNPGLPEPKSVEGDPSSPVLSITARQELESTR